MAEITTFDTRINRYRRAGVGFKREQSLYPSVHINSWHDDFIGDVLDLKWTTTSAGASASAVIVAGTLNGILRLASGSDDEAGAFATTGLQWKGDLNCIMQARVKVNAITDGKFEIGWADALSYNTDDGVVNVLSSQGSGNASDYAVAIMDTDDTGPTNVPLQFVNAKASTETTKLEPATVTFAAGEYLTITVALRGDEVKYTVAMDADDVSTDGTEEPYYESDWVENGIEGGTLLTPWLYSQTRNAGSTKNLDIDYLRVWQSRV